MQIELSEIQERSIVLAKFMGYKDASLEYKLKWTTAKTIEELESIDKRLVPVLVKGELDEPMFLDYFQYHNSWDWLMPVYKELNNKISEFSKLIQENKPMYYEFHTLYVYYDSIIRWRICNVEIEQSFNQIFNMIEIYQKFFNEYENLNKE